jgi:hypothetical protein
VPDNLRYLHYTLHKLPDGWDIIDCAQLDATQSLGDDLLSAEFHFYMAAKVGALREKIGLFAGKSLLAYFLEGLFNRDILIYKK